MKFIARFKIPILLTSVLILLLSTSKVNALISVPSWPPCYSYDYPGDKAHYDDGGHGIIGRNGLFYGSDDVYTVGDGNYVQCFCPNDSSDGIQTNWWYVEGRLTDDQITIYRNKGWILTLGHYWGLEDGRYLARNIDYQCKAEPTPTPTPTPTPSPSPSPTATPTPSPSPSPSPTATPTPTPTPSSSPDNHSSECVALTPSVYGGTAPLTVEFQAEGYDSKGYVEEYEFNFNDTSDGQKQVVRTIHSNQTHRFEHTGSYTVDVMIKDTKGVWKSSDKCRVTVNVQSEPQVLGASTTDTLPKTGVAGFGLGFFFTGVAGFSIWKKFR